MHRYSSMAMSARAARRETACASRRQSNVIENGTATATIVNEICGAVGILFFAAGICRIVDISKPVGWSIALVAALILAEITSRLKLAFCGSLISLLLTIAVFGAMLDASGSLPTAALAAVAANLMYLVRFKISLVLLITSIALTGVYIAATDATLDFASVSLIAACLLLTAETAQTYRKHFRLFAPIHKGAH